MWGGVVPEVEFDAVDVAGVALVEFGEELLFGVVASVFGFFGCDLLHGFDSADADDGAEGAAGCGGRAFPFSKYEGDEAVGDLVECGFFDGHGGHYVEGWRE